MIYVYRRARSDSARHLAEALEGRRIRRLAKKLPADSWYVCWGEAWPFGDMRYVLNGAAVRSKLTDVKLLEKLKVPTIEVSLTPKEGWLPRIVNHTGGLDLLRPPAHPEFWVKKEVFVKEFRVHSFDGQSIRAGIKVPRQGFDKPHAWIRSWDGGWRISYDGKSIKQRHRDVAHKAVEALGLTFGAVDIGERKDKSLVVLEVNRAPGLEGGTIGCYADAIHSWIGDH